MVEETTLLFDTMIETETALRDGIFPLGTNMLVKSLLHTEVFFTLQFVPHYPEASCRNRQKQRNMGKK